MELWSAGIWEWLTNLISGRNHLFNRLRSLWSINLIYTTVTFGTMALLLRFKGVLCNMSGVYVRFNHIVINLPQCLGILNLSRLMLIKFDMARSITMWCLGVPLLLLRVVVLLRVLIHRCGWATIWIGLSFLNIHLLIFGDFRNLMDVVPEILSFKF
jgi:hypothetical protein